MAQQTAVEWLVEQYANENYSIAVFELAKQMEKEQIMKAARQCHFEGVRQSAIRQSAKNSEDYIAYGEQYYNETFGGQGSPDTSPKLKTNNMAQQTAVDYIIGSLRQLAFNKNTHLGMGDVRVTQGLIDKLEEQAKQMEKQQIRNCLIVSLVITILYLTCSLFIFNR